MCARFSWLPTPHPVRHLLFRYCQRWFNPICKSYVKQHSLRFLPHHPFWLQVYHEQCLLAFYLLNILLFGFHPGQYCSLVIPEIYDELNQLL